MANVACDDAAVSTSTFDFLGLSACVGNESQSQMLVHSGATEGKSREYFLQPPGNREMEQDGSRLTWSSATTSAPRPRFLPSGNIRVGQLIPMLDGDDVWVQCHDDPSSAPYPPFSHSKDNEALVEAKPLLDTFPAKRSRDPWLNLDDTFEQCPLALPFESQGRGDHASREGLPLLVMPVRGSQEGQVSPAVSTRRQNGRLNAPEPSSFKDCTLSCKCHQREGRPVQDVPTAHKVKYIGVRMRGKSRWVAEIKDNNHNVRKWLGTFGCPVQAAQAFDAAARVIRGPHTRANFKLGDPDYVASICDLPREMLTEPLASLVNAFPKTEDSPRQGVVVKYQKVSTAWEHSGFQESSEKPPSAAPKVAQEDSSMACRKKFMLKASLPSFSLTSSKRQLDQICSFNSSQVDANEMVAPAIEVAGHCDGQPSGSLLSPGVFNNGGQTGRSTCEAKDTLAAVPEQAQPSEGLKALELGMTPNSCRELPASCSITNALNEDLMESVPASTPGLVWKSNEESGASDESSSSGSCVAFWPGQGCFLSAPPSAPEARTPLVFSSLWQQMQTGKPSVRVRSKSSEAEMQELLPDGPAKRLRSAGVDLGECLPLPEMQAAAGPAGMNLLSGVGTSTVIQNALRSLPIEIAEAIVNDTTVGNLCSWLAL